GEISRAAQVTSGAIYHHFPDKKALFQAVAEDITARLVANAAKAVAKEKSGWRQLVVGFSSVLASSAAPEVKLAFLAAPVVLGLDAWREVEAKHTAPLLLGVLQRMVESGELEAERMPLLARTLRGMMLEAAMAVAESKHPQATRKALNEMVETMVMSLAPTRGHG